eukprot:1156492-Pelagomonas_calceolata.AAC.4
MTVWVEQDTVGRAGPGEMQQCSCLSCRSTCNIPSNVMFAHIFIHSTFILYTSLSCLPPSGTQAEHPKGIAIQACEHKRVNTSM